MRVESISEWPVKSGVCWIQTREPRLADDFRIKSAPTALLADATGAVQTRLVGADAVRDYVRSPA